MIVACVRAGTRYGPEYVERLLRGVRRHSTVDYRFVCLTDQKETWHGVENVPIPVGLPGWWSKMKLFDPGWRGDQRMVYLDLDTVVIGNLDPLLELKTRFGICRNLATIPSWPCKYSSCMIALEPGFGRVIYDAFMATRSMLMRAYVRYGDQRAIEHIDDGAAFLQDLLPQGFFSYYRDGFRRDASLLIFGGRAKPHNTGDAWVRQAWVA